MTLVVVVVVVEGTMAMGGCIVLAILVLNSDKIGGIDGLKEKLGPDNAVWNMLPSIGSELRSGCGSLRSGSGYANAGLDAAKPPIHPGSGTLGTLLLGMTSSGSCPLLEEKILMILFKSLLKKLMIPFMF